MKFRSLIRYLIIISFCMLNVGSDFEEYKKFRPLYFFIFCYNFSLNCKYLLLYLCVYSTCFKKLICYVKIELQFEIYMVDH